MYRHIIVPVDRSPFAEKAIPFGAAIARRHGGTLHLVMVHTLAVPDAVTAMPLPADGTFDLAARREEEAYLAKLAGDVAMELAITPETRLLEGPVAASIEEYADAAGADLVVLSTHGRSGLERAWLGSIADRLVRKLTIPLLLVRPNAAMPEPRVARVLVGLDGSLLAEDALRAARVIAGPGGTCTAVRVAVPPQLPGSPYVPDAARANRDALHSTECAAREYLDDIAHRVRGDWGAFATRVVTAYQPARALTDLAVELDADLIAIATHGRGPVMRALIGSVTDRVIRTSTVPVLVVPAKASAAGLATGHRESLETSTLAP